MNAMYSVCFENKVITFTDEVPAGCDTVWLADDEPFEIAKVLQKLENSKYLCIKGADPEALFRRFAALFTAVEAAGGVVEDESGRYLMIFRNGRWDLPKGHLEAGEAIEQCAVREVEEECGIQGVRCGRLLARTFHFYRMYGRWELKRTHWYAMQGGGEQPLTPQREEGITRVEWIPRAEIAVRLETSFETIREVFRQAGVLPR